MAVSPSAMCMLFSRIVYLVEIACVAAVACHASEGFQLVAETVGRHGVEAVRFAAPYAGVETHRVGRRAALLHSAEGFGGSRLVASGEHHLSQQIGEPRLLSVFGCGGGLAQRAAALCQSRRAMAASACARAYWWRSSSDVRSLSLTRPRGSLGLAVHHPSAR